MTTPKTFIYPEYYTQEDWGLVTQSSTESENLGLTSSTATENEDYGLVSTSEQELQDFQDQRRLIALDNSEESATYRYTEKSVLLAQDPEDFGSIASAVTESDDYGSITDSELSAINDNAFIYNTDDAFPYGTVEFSGAALSVVKIQFIHVSSGSFEVSGTADDSNTFREIGSGSFSAFGGSAEALGSNPPENISLGTFDGTKVERNTYSYNERAILPAQSPEDFGSIASAVTESDDYGSITESELDDASDNAFIYFENDAFPYGTIEISGSAIPFFEIKFIHVAEGGVELSGVLRERNIFREIGSGSFSAISGSADALGSNPPDQTLLGTLSGTKVEKTTFRYTEKSIVVFDGYEDYGTLSDSVVYEDYGSLSDNVTYEDNGLLPWTETTYPYGSFSAFGGHSESFGPDPSEESVLGTFSGTLVEKSIFREIGSGSFSTLSGSAEVFDPNPSEETVLGTFSGTKVEKKTYSYNERAILPAQDPDDFGSIADAVTESDDYGSITDSELDDASDNAYIYNTDDTFPYGTIEISGSAVPVFEIQFIHIADGTAEFSGVLRERNTFREIGSGTLSTISGSAEAFGANPPENIALGTFNGTKVEKSTFSYNEKAIVVFDGYEDYGTLSDSVTYEDYGSLSDDVTYEDNGLLPWTETTYPFGTVEFSGSALTEVNIQFIHVASGTIEISGTAGESDTFREIGSGSFSAFNGAAEALGSNPPENILLGTFSGTKVERNTFREIGSGTLSTISGAAEALGVNPPDQTLLGTFSGTLVEKSIFREIGSGTLSAISGSAEAFGANPPENTLLGTFSGIKVEKSTFREIGSGSFSTISGAAEALGVNPPDQTLLGTFSGTLVEKNTFREIGSGFFSAISGAAEVFGPDPFEESVLGTFSGTKVEKKVYSYNEKAIFIFDGPYEDYGSVASSTTSTEDYGALSDSVAYDEYEDYGLISPPFNETTHPYGTVEISGSALTEVNIQFIHIADGTAEFSGVLRESNTFREIGSGSFSTISGSAEALGANPPENIALGTFNGTKVEKSTFSYNERAILPAQDPDDFGSIADAVTESDDYGSIVDSELVDANDYAYIYNTTDQFPFGTIEISGSAIPVFEIQFVHIADGTAEFSGIKVEKGTFREIGSGSFSAFGGSAEVFGPNPQENIVLGTLSGTKVEKTTFSYTEKSVVVFDGYEDYGTLSDTVTYEDYGTLSDDVTYEDNGLLPWTETTYPYGTFSIFGGSAEVFGPNPQENIVLGTFSGTKIEKSTFREIGLGSAIISGSAAESFIPATIIAGVEGSAEFSGDKVEKKVYSYNEKAIFIFDGSYEDYGSINDATTYEDYGSVNDSVAYDAYEDYGFISPPFNQTTLPFGTIEISGSHLNDVVYVPHYTGSGSATFSGSAPESFTPATEIGSGSFSAFGGSAEALGSNPPENILLGTFSGTKIEKSVFREIGSGSATFSGTATNVIEPRHLASGSATFSGSAPQSFTPATEIGSGSFSAFGGSAEALGSNPPDQTLLFEVSGTKIEKSTFREIGSGLATFSGTSIERENLEFVGGGTVEFSGVLRESNTFREIGSGFFSAISGAAEVFGANPPENILLGTFSGTKVEKSIFREIGSGSATFSGTSVDRKNPGFAGRGTVEFSGSATQSFTPATEIGSGSFSAFGGSAEVFGANPSENILLGTFSGTKIEKGTFSHFGSGTIRVLGDADTAVIALAIHVSQFGNISLSGSAAESFTPATEIGSGTLSAISGAAEALGANPPENIVLFNISGGYNNLKAAYAHEGSGTVGISGAHLNDVVYVPHYTGSGTLSAISGAADSTLVNPPDQTLLFGISGTTGESNTFREIGSGSFSAFGGHSESFGPDPSEESVLGTFTGTLVEKSTFSYSGTGTLSAISGAAEALGANPPENIALGTFNGTKVEKSTFREIGSGSFSVFNGAAEESLGINPPDQTLLVEISGTTGERNIFSEIGSGSFSAFNGAAEALGANPPENIALGTFNGTKVEKSTFREIGSGSFEISGNCIDRLVIDNVGSGSFSAISGAAEALGSNPPDDTALGTFSGTKVEKSTFREIGSGSATFSGTMLQDVQVYVPHYPGSGVIPITGSARGNFVLNYRGETQIDINGSGNESITPEGEIGGGIINISGVGIGKSIRFKQPYVFVTII